MGSSELVAHLWVSRVVCGELFVEREHLPQQLLVGEIKLRFDWITCFGDVQIHTVERGQCVAKVRLCPNLGCGSLPFLIPHERSTDRQREDGDRQYCEGRPDHVLVPPPPLHGFLSPSRRLRLDRVVTQPPPQVVRQLPRRCIPFPWFLCQTLERDRFQLGGD